MWRQKTLTSDRTTNLRARARRVAAGVLALTVGAVLLVGTGSGEAAAAPGPRAVINVASGACLTVEGAGTDAGRPAVGADCTGAGSQEWTYVPTSDGYGNLRAGHSNLCLTVDGNQARPGAPIEQDRCADDRDRTWVAVDSWDNADQIQFKVRSTGMCLTLDGTTAVQEPCRRGDGRQLWTTSIVDDHVGRLHYPHIGVAGREHGPTDYHTFFQGVVQYDLWTYRDIALYTPPGEIDIHTANVWLGWYARVDDRYRQMSGRSDADFANVFRRHVPPLDRRMKVLGHVATCGAGCGSKQQAEADPSYLPRMLEDTQDWVDHWIFFYEMGRGGSPEAFYGHAVWPNNTVILPHLMAGVAFHELGGDGGMERGIPGLLLDDLVAWEQSDKVFVEEYAERQSHDLVVAMLYRILQDTDYATIERILRNMEQMPEATEAVQAMCDFQAAINAATDNRYIGHMVHRWHLPGDCGWAVPPDTTDPSPTPPPSPDPDPQPEPPTTTTTQPGPPTTSPDGGATVTGAVVHADGSPAAEVIVDLFTDDRASFVGFDYTDDSGRYRFEVDGGSCGVLTFIAPVGQRFPATGTEWLNQSYCPGSGDEVTVDPVEVTGPGPLATLGGQVTDASGAAVSGVEVALYRATGDGSRGRWIRDATSGPDGSYDVEVSAGCYVLDLVAPDGRTWAATGSPWQQEPVCVADGETVDTISGSLR